VQSLLNKQKKGKTVRNDRFLGVPAESQFFSKVESIDDLPDDTLDQIEKFFMNYNELAKKRFKPMKRIDAPKALKLIKHT
jgi:inorganic pyrophosphatase